MRFTGELAKKLEKAITVDHATKEDVKAILKEANIILNAEELEYVYNPPANIELDDDELDEVAGGFWPFHRR